MMNDVLRVETSTAESTTLTEEDKAKNDAFGVVTLILNLIALLFIIFTVAPEYRVLKRLIALFKKVCFNISRAHRLTSSVRVAYLKQLLGSRAAKTFVHRNFSPQK
jgi:hypothetical protein